MELNEAIAASLAASKKQMETTRMVLASIGDAKLSAAVDELVKKVLDLLSENHEVSLAAMPSIQYYFLEKSAAEARKRAEKHEEIFKILADLADSVKPPSSGEVKITTEVTASATSVEPEVVAVKCHIPPGLG